MLAKYDTVLEKAVTDKNIKRLVKKQVTFFTKGDLETIFEEYKQRGRGNVTPRTGAVNVGIS